MQNINELIGIIKGINFDGVINDKEVLRLQSWVDKNRNLAYDKQQMELIKMVDSVLEDHIIDDSEKELLITACEEFLKDAGDNSSRIYELNGIIEGVVCDGEVNEAEVLRLKEWMDAYGDCIRDHKPSAELCKAIDDILEDGIVTEEELFYDAYEEFYKMASTSETFREFCIDAYGADFSQDGFSDVKQIDMIIPFIKNSGAHILDIGCGNGKMIKYLGDKTGAYIYGFDYSDNAIMQAKKNNNSDDFCVGVMEEIEYSKESFDVIVAMDSVYFAHDMATFVKQIKNWLKPGGVLFVAYQEGDVMDKTANVNTTVFAEAMRTIGWEYEVKDISEDSYNMLVKKRDVALAYKDKFEAEGNGMWGNMLIEQTDYVLQGKEEYLKHLARYIYVCRK